MQRDLVYGDKLTRLMQDYVEDGLLGIMDKYEIKDLKEMLEQEIDEETKYLLKNLIKYLPLADALIGNLEELSEQWEGEDSVFERREKEQNDGLSDEFDEPDEDNYDGPMFDEPDERSPKEKGEGDEEEPENNFTDGLDDKSEIESDQPNSPFHDPRMDDVF